MKDIPVHRGKHAETAVLLYLKKQGLQELAQNFHARSGEIDLVMLDKSTIVFVEVRLRSSTRFMDPLETIDQRKVRRIIRTGQAFLQQYKGPYESCRFDIVTLTGKIRSPRIDWIKNAFYDE